MLFLLDYASWSLRKKNGFQHWYAYYEKDSLRWLEGRMVQIMWTVWVVCFIQRIRGITALRQRIIDWYLLYFLSVTGVECKQTGHTLYNWGLNGKSTLLYSRKAWTHIRQTYKCIFVQLSVYTNRNKEKGNQNWK